MNKFKLDMPEKSLWYLVICGGIILLFLLVVMFPVYRYQTSSANEVKKMEYQIEAQKELGPIYLILLKTMENKNARVLPNPPKTTIPRTESVKFQNALKTMAEKSGLRIVSSTPDLSTLTSSSSSLLYNAVLKGEFANFRKMLIELGALTYLDRIEEIRIQQNTDSMEFRIKLWIALGS
ncbi:MAG: hypothetical protein ABSC54_08235 [Smithellaceae bacterium]|jgi:hypothetical protein